jgi:hypothetical protein
MYIPLPCSEEHAFSCFITLHWGAGVGSSRGELSHPAGKVRGNATSSVQRRVVSQSLHWGDGLLRDGSRIWDSAHCPCSVAIDCAGDEMYCAAPCDGDATTLHRRRHFSGFTIHWGNELLRNGSRILEAAHKACIVATDCAGGDSDCAAPFDVHSTTLQRGRRIQQFHSTPLGRWSGFESRRALAYCRQSQRKHHKFKGRRQGGRSVIPLGRWKKV